MLLQYLRGVKASAMAHQITESEQQRMKQFAATPKYQRGPHLLEPESEDADDEQSSR